MKKNTVKKLVLASAILSIIGSILVVINFFVVSAILAKSGSSGDMLKGIAAAMPINIVVAAIGIATLVLGILLATALTKFDKKSTAAILLIVAGALILLITYAALVLWVIAAVLLLRLKFDDDDAEPSDVQMFM